jgi:hypothetical protein
VKERYVGRTNKMRTSDWEKEEKRAGNIESDPDETKETERSINDG